MYVFANSKLRYWYFISGFVLITANFIFVRIIDFIYVYF